MDIQEKNYQMTDHEKMLYLLGGYVFAGLLLLTIFIGSLVSPLILLQLRLLILGTGLIYYLAISFYYVRSMKRTNLTVEIIEEKLVDVDGKHNEIIIWFNGRELGRM